MQQESVIFIYLLFGYVYSICAPENLMFIGFISKPRRDEVMQVEISSKKCVGQYIQYYSWKVIDYDTGNIVQTSYTPFIFISGYDYSISNGVFEKTYGLSIEASHYPQMIFSSFLEMEFEFQPVPMSIVLMGGGVRTHPAGELLIVDAWTLSVDRSYSFNEKVIGDEFEWKVSPDVPVLDNRTLKLVISPNFINVGDELFFEIRVVRTKFKRLFDEKFAYQKVSIVGADNPTIYLVCIRNCQTPHFEDNTIFTVLCTSKCRDLEYRWEIMPNISDYQTQFGTGFDKLLIEARAFRPGEYLIVRVFAGLQASATMVISYMERLKPGMCIPRPRRGISGFTVFKVNCSGFQSANGQLSYILYRSKEKISEAVQVLHQKESYFEVTLPPSKNIIIRVVDEHHMSISMRITLEVVSFFDYFPRNISRIFLKKLILSDSPTSVTSTTLSHDRAQALHKIILSVEATGDNTELTTTEKEDLRKHLADNVFLIPPNNYLRADQTFTVYKYLHQLAPLTDTYIKKRGADILRLVTGSLHFSLHTLRERIPIHILRVFAKKIIVFGSYLLDEIEEVKEILEKQERSVDYMSYDDFLAQKMEIRDHMRQTFDNVLASFQAVGIVIVLKALPNELPFIFRTHAVILSFKRISKSQLLRERFSVPFLSDDEIILSNSFMINVMQTKFSFVDFQFGIIKKQVLWWQKNYSLYNTDFVLLDFFNYKFKFEVVKGDFTIYLRAKKIHVGVLKGSIKGSGKELKVYRVALNDSGVLVVKFIPPKGQSYRAAISDHYCNQEYMLNNASIIRPTSQTRNLYSTSKPEKRYVYVCIQKIGVENIDFVAHFSSLACTSYNQLSGFWTYGGCKAVGAEIILGTYYSMKCSCDHLSFFGGVTAVPPVKLNENFNVNFTLFLNENWLIVFVVLSLLTLFAVLLMLAAKKDRAFKKKDIICKLDDDVPGDSFIYLVVIFTGRYFDAGTTADVGFQIIGEKSSSRNHLIKCVCVKMLQRSAQDWFIIHTPEDLGALKKIRLWHNCKGSKPHWYCKKVIIQDLKSGEHFYFIVEKWFSLIWGKSKVYREIPVCNKRLLKKTTFLFKKQLSWNMREHHMWFSIFLRDVQSNFNSKERVGAAFSMLFLTMMASALLYGIPTKTPLDSISPSNVSFVSVRGLVIYISAIFICLPISLIIILLFRESSSNMEPAEECDEIAAPSKGLLLEYKYVD